MAVRTVLNASVCSILEVVVDGVVLPTSCARKLIRIETLVAEIVTYNAGIVIISSKIPNNWTASKTLRAIKVVINDSCYVCAGGTISCI